MSTTYQEQAQDWPAAFLSLFGKRLDEDEVSGIEAEANNVFRGSLKGWEMTKAVRRCAMDAPSGGRKYPPSGEEIIRAIKANRRDYMQAKGGAAMGAHPCAMGYGMEGFEHWSRALRNADEVERWNIICRPFDAKHCAEREKFCRENGLRFHRFDHKEMQPVGIQ